MLKNLKIRTRLVVGFSVVLLLTLVMFAVSSCGLKKTNDEWNYFVEYSFSADGAIKQCRIDANVAARTLREMAINTDTSTDDYYEREINEEIETLHKNVEQLKRVYLGSDGLEQEYEIAIKEWTTTAEQIVAEIKAGNMVKAQDMILNDCTPRLEKMVTLAQEIDKSIGGRRTEMMERTLKDTRNTIIFMGALLVVSIAVGMLMAKKVTDSIVFPIYEVELAASEMAKGNLNSEIKYQGKDAVGTLAESMRTSMNILTAYIEDIDNVY